MTTCNEGAKPMKIPPAIVEDMRAAIVPIDTPERRHRYLTGDFPRADRCKDLDMRYRWDLYFESGARRLIYDMNCPIDPHSLTDAHIDTALRRIVPSLKEAT